MYVLAACFLIDISEPIHSPTGYLLILENQRDMSIWTPVKRYCVLQPGQHDLLINSHDERIYDAGGKAVTKQTTEGALGYFAITPSGRAYGLYEGNMKFSNDNYLGRVALLTASADVVPNFPQSKLRLLEFCKVVYPGDNDSPLLFPFSIAFRYQGDEIVTRKLSIGEKAYVVLAGYFE